MYSSNGIVRSIINNNFKIFILIIITFIILNILYVYTTKFTKIITIDEKHSYGSNNNKGNQTVSDKKNNIYIVSNTPYLLHWKSVELFNKLDKEKKYKIEGYGKRIPFLTMFPNIVKAKEIN